MWTISLLSDSAAGGFELFGGCRNGFYELISKTLVFLWMSLVSMFK